MRKQRQRLCRRLVCQPGDSVLDLCCYSGGFALNAVKGGAARATGVDSSAAAVALAARNAALNGLGPTLGANSGGGGGGGGVATFEQGDIGAFMAAALDRGEQFNVVVRGAALNL